ncbi:MAG: hypothetical protein KGO53_00130 [Alphaproteobacteria bacterium]|nr:hypothetical protein [Alphaproteobacteria bacterium]
MSQPTLDHLLATVNVTGSSSCAHVELKLNRPINVTGADPAGKGLDIAVHIEPLATTLPSESGASLKEAASVPPQNAAGLGGVVYDPAAPQGPVIHFVFAKVMAYQLKRDEDNRHVVIDVAGPADAQACLGKAVDGGDAPKGDLKKSFDSADASAAGPATPGQDAQAALDDGKKQLAAGDFNRATAFFTKAVSLGTGRVKQDAQEMLGLAHERAGQFAFARAEYETYLGLYPSGPDAARVKDRLAGVTAAMEDQANKQFALHQAKTAGTQTSNTDGKGDGVSQQGQTIGPGNVAQFMKPGLRSNLAEPVKDPNAWTWAKNGSIAQYYYRDDNFTPSTPGGPLFGQHHVFQNEALTSADYFIHGENKDYAVEGRISAYNEQGFGDQANIANSSLSTLYVDGKLKGPGLGARIGRQSKSTGGVFGRFDGGVLTYEGVKNFKAQAVAGSPVYSRSATPFADNRYFYGASLEYTAPSKDWSANIYAIEQNVGDIVDRRAIGGEARYTGAKLMLYSAADYDIFFHELNNAYVTGTWLPRQGTTVYATVDYRKLPFLLTSNALMGQQNFTSLQTLVDGVGLDNVNEWAGDRTASSQSVSLGASQQLNDKWQATVDATLAYYTGTPASGGVDATPDPGLDFYGSVSLNGTGIFRLNDTVSTGLRYANSSSGVTYMADAYVRFPVTEKFRLGPRFRVSLRDAKTSDQVQYLVMPSLSASYKINKSWSLESELGFRWQDTVTGGIGNQMLDVLATAGYRFEF